MVFILAAVTADNVNYMARYLNGVDMMQRIVML